MYGVDSVFARRVRVPAELTKTLLWYVAPSQKYIYRISYFSLFRARQAP